MLKAWAQLVRLPNVFTAPADVIAGAALGLYVPHEDNGLPGNIVLLCLISVCYYMAGMILNDVADIEEDRRERPFRPLPSGRISKRTASIVGFLLLAAGLAIGLLQLPKGATWQQSLPLYALPMLILSYNFWLKHTWLGPIMMGLCRGCNLLLGTLMTSHISPVCYHAAIATTVYITGISIIAQAETRTITKWRIGLGVVFMYFAMVLTAVVLSINQKGIPQYVLHANYLLVLSIILFNILWIPASINPKPSHVGRAIKYSILGLIVLDTLYTMLSLGYPGLLILVLLIPAMLLGKFIYST